MDTGTNRVEVYYNGSAENMEALINEIKSITDFTYEIFPEEHGGTLHCDEKLAELMARISG